jgi:hypothetical protein
MAKYREQIKARAPASAIVTVESTVAAAYTHLAQKYGLADMRLGASRDRDAQTLEQEYQSYITAPLSPEGTDMLRFWEVCNPLFSRYYFTDIQMPYAIVQRLDDANIFQNCS